MPYSNTVDSYLPLKSIELATKKYQEYFENSCISNNFIRDLVKRKLIKSRSFANIDYVHPAMFTDWLIEHKNKDGRPYQKEGYMDAIDIRKDFKETTSYYAFLPNDIEVLLENNLIGNSVLLEKKKRYILRDELDSFYKKDKLYCHSDIVNLVHTYLHETFGIISVKIEDVLGFDIDNIGSLVYRSYITPIYFSENKTNNSYLSTDREVNNCLLKLKQIIRKNAIIQNQKHIEEGFHFRLKEALTQKALLVNRLKPFHPPSLKKRKSYKQELQRKFTAINEFKKFLQDEVEFIDINTDLNEFIKQLKNYIPSGYGIPIYQNTFTSGLHINKVSVPFDKKIEMYEEALLEHKKIF